MSSPNIEKLRELSGHLIDPDIAIQIFESYPDATVMVDSAGIIQLVNRQAEILFGYLRKELFDNSVTMLVPVDRQDRHDVHVADYFSEPRIRPMGIGLDLKAVRKDGTSFTVEINLSPIITAQGVFALAVIRRKAT